MGFQICFEKLSAGFSLPSEVVDRHLKLAGALQLRVILYCYKNPANTIDVPKIAEALSASESDINDALMFWSELGYFKTEKVEKNKGVKNVADKPKEPPKPSKPTRNEVAARGLESPEIAFLLNEAQVKFGRMLKQSESSVLVWLYDDMGMDVSIILMVLEYAV